MLLYSKHWLVGLTNDPKTEPLNPLADETDTVTLVGDVVGMLNAKLGGAKIDGMGAPDTWAGFVRVWEYVAYEAP